LTRQRLDGWPDSSAAENCDGRAVRDESGIRTAIENFSKLRAVNGGWIAIKAGR
jgi:hypothetical protein